MKKHILMLLICGRIAPAQMGSVTDSARWMEYQRALAPLENAGERPGNWRQAEYTVSVARLSHRPPGKAVSAYSRGVKLTEAGNWQKGVEEFAKAVEIDPNFADAHGNLGANYVRLGKYEAAEKELRRAIQLDPATGSNHSNLGLLMVFVGRFEEAEYEARTGVDLDPHNFKSQYLLGMLLMRNPRSLARAAECLAYAAREFPGAHLVLAKLHRREGNEALAARELESYKKNALR